MGWQRTLQLSVSSLALVAGVLATQAAYSQTVAPAPQPAPETERPTASTLAPAEQLPGLWQGQLPNNQTVRMLFQADGSMLLFHPDSEQKIALSASYWFPEVEFAESDALPTAIDLEAHGDLVQGIIEFAGPDQIQLDTNPASIPRPTEFGAQAVMFQRVDLNVVNLDDYRIVSFEEWMDSL